jgi:hypothetical protein
VRSLVLGLLAAAVLLAGCAPSVPTMRRSDMSTINQDHHDCVVEAEHMVGIATRGRLYYYEICMRARGYTE